MKVLLVGDISGVHEYLADGLREVGHDCELLKYQRTSTRMVEGERDFFSLRNYGLIGNVLRPFATTLRLSQLPIYDAISIMHRVSLIDKPSPIRYLDTPVLASRTTNLSYIALGCDEIAYIEKSKLLPYKPCDSCEQLDSAGRNCDKNNRSINARGLRVLNKHYNSVIVPAIEYYHVKDDFHRRIHKIPFPITTSRVPWHPAKSDTDRVRIVHTPTRMGFKGTPIVEQAIRLLSQRRDDFEYEILNNLPFNEFSDRVAQTDIVIDQVWSQSPGMNALYFLAMGKIVLSGNTALGQSFFPFASASPIFNAPPDPAALALKLENILESRSQYPGLAQRGRNYIQMFHDSARVAQQYVEAWSNRAK